MALTSPISTNEPQAYATNADFRRVFVETMDSVHLLAFLLTADHRKAEGCFVSGLEDCSKGSYVFRDWARSWARRTIVRNAVRMLRPHRNGSMAASFPDDPFDYTLGRTPEARAAILSILGLEDFERFVFVMSVLEIYSDQDCSILLGCSRQDVGVARVRALLIIANSQRMQTLAGSGSAPTIVTSA